MKHREYRDKVIEKQVRLMHDRGIWPPSADPLPRPLVRRRDPAAGPTAPAPYRRTGERDEAQEHLTTATTLYREMDMRFWLEKAVAELQEVA